MRTRAIGGWASPRWLAITLVAAIGVIWILPATRLHDGYGLLAATIAGLALLGTAGSRSTPAPVHAL
jgi:hypothetical protein